MSSPQKDPGMEAGHGSRCSALAVRGEGLCFSFGSHKTLRDLNIAVDRGVIYGLLGPSGCGKTTLLRCIVGRHRPSSGTIKIYGGSPGQAGFTVPGQGVGYMPQELALYPEITIEETLIYFGRIYQMSEKVIKERIDFLTDFLELPDKEKEIKNLSGGQQRRVSFAAALIHKPPLVILDEPTVGVDPLLRKSIWNYLRTLATDDFLTIIITTHYVEEARQAHMVGLMRDGRLLAEANPENLIKRYRVLSLEDVFLKLCIKSSDSENEDDNKLLDKVIEMNNLNKDLHEDVWVLQESQTNCIDPSGPPMKDSDHKTSLLDCSSNPHAVLYPEQSCRAIMRSSAMRMRALIVKNFIRQKRCLPLLFFQLFVPTFQVIVFCFCFGGEPYDLPLAIVNSETDPSGKSNYFLEHLNPQTIKQVPYTNLTQAFESVHRGENWGVLHIKPTFTDSMINRFLEGIYVDNETIESSTIVLYLDMTSQMVSITLSTKIMESFQTFAENWAKLFYQNPLIAQPPLKIGPPIYGHEKPDFTEFMAPGTILSITYIMAVSLSAMSIIIEKKEGLLDRSLIAGVQTWEVIFSILFTLFIIMLFQVALLLVFVFVTFNLTCLGNWIWLVIAALLVGMEGMAFGLFVSSIVSNENFAVIITTGSFYPNVLLSGIIWPLEAMPFYLRQISYFLPLTLISHTVRCVVSRGWSILDHGIWGGYLVAIAWIVPMIVISGAIFKYKK